MTSEGILLVVPHVKLKKNEGELFLMAERLGWMSGNKGSFAVSHNYSEIKTQKISPEGKAKIQLQVCLHDGNATTFQFVNPIGLAEQLADREKVKELLQQTLPKFKRPMNKDLEEKNKLLTENPQLKQLYFELVRSGVISAEEFWTEYAAPYVKQQAEAQNLSQQETGISTSFLSDIIPQTDGSNGSVRYVLTNETIACIYRTYPSVQQKHSKYVPHKMTEAEFWKKFFSSHYLHRDKNITDAKDLFTDCSKKDDEVLKQVLSTPVNDPLLDLTNLKDVTQDEQPAFLTGGKSSSLTNQNLIKRFNQHSILLLKATFERATEEGTTEAPPGEAQESKRARIEEAVSYEDLEREKPLAVEPINLSRTERYHTAPPRPIGQSESNGKGSSDVQGELDPGTFKNVLLRWMRGGDKEYNPADLLQSATAIDVLKELSVGGSLMRRAQPHAAIHLPVDLQSELKQLYLTLSEIVRHFWAAFPPSTPQLVEKAGRMVESLHRFNQAKLMPFEQKVIQVSTSSEAENILSPLKIQMQLALSKHSQFNKQISERRTKTSIPM